MSGVRMIPYSLGASLVAIASGQVVSRTGQYRPTIWFGFVSVAKHSLINSNANQHVDLLGGYDARLWGHDHGLSLI